MVGFDCDRPRGIFINSEKGSKMAERKINSIERISTILETLSIPRTYFLCGQFVESMAEKYGEDRIQKAFNPKDTMLKSLLQILNNMLKLNLNLVDLELST